MTVEHFKFDRDEIIIFLLDNLISTRARLLAVETALYAYIGLHTPELTDKFRMAATHQERIEMLKSLDDLQEVDQAVSDRIRNELNHLWGNDQKET